MFRRLTFLFSFVLVLGLAGTCSADLVGWWRLDEGSGTIASDSSGNGRNGTFTGDPAWVAGYFGQALEFDGDDHVDTGYTANLTNWTIAAWVRSPAAPSGDAPSGPVHREQNYQFNWNHSDATYRGAAAMSVGGTWYAAKYEPLQANTWYYLTATYDGDAMRAYRDGVLITTNSSPSGSPSSEGNSLKIARHAAAAQFFTGIVDEVRVYNQVLTENDILSIMRGGGGYPYALNPSPADGAIHPDTWITLSWRSGDFAASHDVYLGDNFDDVNNGTGGTFRSNQTSTYYVAGFPGFAYPDGLVPGTTYYWRIDEVNVAEPNSPWKGPIWSFFIPPKKAYNPNPADGSKFVAVDVTLTWTAGLGTKLHTVYFGDNLDTVTNAAGGIPQAVTQYKPTALTLDKTYYWRVDEFDGATTHKGNVWSFATTLPGLGTAIASRWSNISGTDLNTLKNAPMYPNNPSIVETVTQFQWDGPDTDNYGGRIEAWLYAPATGNYTFWLASDDQGELWLSTDDDSINIELIAYVKDSPTAAGGWTNLNEWTKYPSQKSLPIPLAAGEKYYIMALWKEGGGGDHCQAAWQGPGIPTLTVIPGTNLSPFKPLNAYGAKPSNRATGVTQTPILEWKPGLQTASHEVYFGTNEQAVANATKSSPEYKGSKAMGSESYNPGKLAWETTYYWRVDEINNVNPASPWIGSVWSFTTADFLIIDDFESYGSGANQIWYSWHDGLGYGAPGTPGYFAGNGTGAAVGDENTASFTEETIVHGGKQAMPVAYDNNKQGKAKYSEAELKLLNAKDWTEQGVAELSIWFRGRAGSVGSFTEAPAGTFTMTASGTDIWDLGTAGNYHDEFHFAYKTLTGAGSIVARVQSVQNTNGWAKAGVMIRETLDGGSRHMFVAITPSNGVAQQGRPDPGAASFNANQTGVTAPHWVKLERDLAGNFTVTHSANGTTWSPVTGATPQNIQMGSNVYIGLAVTAHDATATCQAVFTNVTITGSVSPQWAHQDIGIASNAAEPLYVAVSNAAGQPAVVVHPNPAAAQITTWTEWVIPLQSLQGITLNNVDTLAIGLGTRGNQTTPGGSGKMYFDDIRLYRQRTP